VQTNVLIKEECVLQNKNKSYPYKTLSVFYNSCLKTFGSHLVYRYLKLSVLWLHILFSPVMRLDRALC